jgi:NTP pyrophosphatase (non-canonical NTP hydrolase)
MDSITKIVQDYYEVRKLVKPTIWEALGWVSAELGEVYEVIMSWSPKWVRNNPQDHPVKTKEDLAEELGDVILMVIAAGLSEGVDPLEAMLNKIARKTKEARLKQASLTVTMEPSSPEEFE